MSALVAVSILAAQAICTSPVVAREGFKGPVAGRVLRVIDGDTFAAEVFLWPGHVLTVNIRLRGIDAPELRARCAAERAAAASARDALAALVADGGISISNVAGAKYYGRVLADATTADGRALADELLGRKLVRPQGAGRRGSWC